MDKNKPISEAILKLSELHQKFLEDLTQMAIIAGEIEIGNRSEILKRIAELNSEIRNLYSDNSETDFEGQIDINNDNDLNNDLNSEVRQLAILSKVRELSSNGAGCGIKDLIALFPDVSDRTLRYDLQKLCADGSILKVGSRGPNTVYRV